MELPARLLALAESIDAERARELVRELGTGPERAAAVLLGSAFPALVASSGDQLDALARALELGLFGERRRTDFAAGAERARASASEAEFLAELRRFAWAERARIALRELLPSELGGAPIHVTARELGSLADVVLELALDEARRQVSARVGPALRAQGEPSSIVAFGMGKLGGRELNAGSDIDLVFVYDSDDGRAGSLSLHDFWVRVVRRAVASIENPTDDGLVFRVDLRLRPEGSQGPVCNSLLATERYYETWGRLWERAALLRARAAAGDLELGALVERQIFVPFVYRHAVDPSIAHGLAEMVERSRAELCSDPARDLKLGPGGIREAEFFVQTLQLVWGGREPSLRVPGTRAALARLESRGLVSHREARRLREAHALLRRLEHRVQWASGIQTHLLPNAPAELARLARSLGHADERGLLDELAHARADIAELFASVMPTERPVRGASPFDALLAALSEGTAPLAEAERLFGSAEPAEHLLALGRRPDGPLGDLTRERFPELGRQLLEAVAASPDAEQAARYLRSVFGRLSTPGAYVAALGEDERALYRLVSVLGSSQFVGDAVVARPDLGDIVLFGGGAVSDPASAVAAEIATQLEALPADADEQDRQNALVTALRIAKRRVTVEVVVADLAASVGTRDATRLLSELADQVLARAVERVLEGDVRGLAVIALGKLGGRDIGYGSDLDVVFVYDPAMAPSLEEAPAYFARRAQRIIRLISEPSAAGPGYELDTRLRPSGSQGLLVTSLSAFARYHGVPLPGTQAEPSGALSSGAAWERQALLRARFSAGDAELGARVIAVAEVAAYERGAPPAEEVHRLRQRMQEELAREREGRYDLKTGRGGLLDVEVAAQWLQMLHGSDPRVRTPDTLTALEALRARQFLEAGDFDRLAEGYRFLRRLEQRMHVLRGTSSSTIDVRAPGLEQLARRMGLEAEAGRSASAQLLGLYGDVTRGVRRAYGSVLGLTTPG